MFVAIYNPTKGTLIIGGPDELQQALVPDLETGLFWYFAEKERWQKARRHECPVSY